MSRPQTKGILISTLFVSLAIIGALFGIDLGQILWIGVVLFVVVAGINFIIWVAVKGEGGKQD